MKTIFTSGYVQDWTICNHYQFPCTRRCYRTCCNDYNETVVI